MLPNDFNQQRLQELEANYRLISEKIFRLEQRRIIEADETTRFKIDKELEQAKQERQHIEQEISAKLAQLAQAEVRNAGVEQDVGIKESELRKMPRWGMMIKAFMAVSALLLLVLGGIIWREDLIPLFGGKPNEDCWTNPVKGRVCSVTLDEAQTVSMQFVWIERGCFQMGCLEGDTMCSDDEKPTHSVCLNGFWMGKYEVTQRQWEVIMEHNPSQFNGDNRPVEAISWDETQEFIQKLNSRLEMTFRLPSEAEWEYACRAGSETMFYFGNEVKELKDYAWYSENLGNQTNPVGQLPPNAWGLYDMLGNVLEWVADSWHDNYNDAPSDGSVWETSGGSKRVLRGGSWLNPEQYVRSAHRESDAPLNRSPAIGFRLVRNK